MSCDFSIEHYIDTVCNYRKAGYKLIQVKDLYDINDHDKYLLVRHDVDLSLKAAKILAAHERVHDIKSSFYILLYSPIYNPLAPSNIEAIREIAGYQHQIGLHIDSRFENSMSSISNSMSLLGGIIGKNIDSYVQHFINETPEVVYPLATDGLRDVIKVGFKYLSESSMNWREGCFCQHIDEYRLLNVAIHPEWHVFEGTRGKVIDVARDVEMARLARDVQEWKDVQVNYLKQFNKVGIDA